MTGLSEVNLFLVEAILVCHSAIQLLILYRAPLISTLNPVRYYYADIYSFTFRDITWFRIRLQKQEADGR